MMTPTEVLIDFTGVLDDLQIQYVVVGSFASSARGVRRATIDADIVVDLTLDQVKSIVDRLSADYYVDDLAARRAILTERAFNAIHLESMFKVDVHISGDSFTRKEMERMFLRDGNVFQVSNEPPSSAPKRTADGANRRWCTSTDSRPGRRAAIALALTLRRPRCCC